MFTSGCAVSGTPTAVPPPWTMLRTPAGTPASRSASTRWWAEAGVSVAGLITTVLPETRAGKIFHEGMAIGKFHGVMSPQTPKGCRTDIANLLGSSDGAVTPKRRLPSAAM